MTLFNSFHKNQESLYALSIYELFSGRFRRRLEYLFVWVYEKMYNNNPSRVFWVSATRTRSSRGDSNLSRQISMRFPNTVVGSPVRKSQQCNEYGNFHHLSGLQAREQYTSSREYSSVIRTFVGRSLKWDSPREHVYVAVAFAYVFVSCVCVSSGTKRGHDVH